MKRSGPIARKAPLKRKPRKPRAGDDPERLAWLRTLPCAMCGSPATAMRRLGSGSVEAHHPTGAGMGTKAPDSKAFPLCGPVGCHYDLHNLTGHFKGWTKSDLQDWQRAQSEVYKVLYRVKTREE